MHREMGRQLVTATLFLSCTLSESVVARRVVPLVPVPPDDEVISLREGSLSNAAVWETSEVGSKFAVETKGTEFLSGALAYGTFFTMLERANAEIEKAVAEGNLTIPTGGTSKGLGIFMEEKSDGSGTTFDSRMADPLSKYCFKKGTFGDERCLIPWGQTVKANGHIKVGDHDIEDDAILEMRCNIKFFDEFMLKLLGEKGPPDVKVKCKACGEPCRIEHSFYKANFEFQPPPCPLKAGGYYPIWGEDFFLPTGKILKSVAFEENMLFSLKHANGSKVFNLHLRGWSFRDEGAGGSW